MKSLIDKSKIELGSEFVFLNENKMKQHMIITKMNKRTFSGIDVKVKRIDGMLQINDVDLHFYHSGKKCARAAKHGDVVEIIGKLKL